MDPVSIAAVGWSVTMVGWLASATISRLLNKCFDYIDDATKKKLAQLQSKLLVLERVMEVVETSPYRPRLEQLFKELKTAYYEAEEILDAVEYHCLERQIKEGKLQSSGSAPPLKRDRKKNLWSPLAMFSPLKNKESGMPNKMLIKSLKKIEEVINEAHQILEKLNLSSISNDNTRRKMVSNAPTTAVSPQKVFGRGNDRDKIVEMLHKKEGDHPSTSNDLCFSVIGIHGVRRSGKSTLAQFVCDEEKDKALLELNYTPSATNTRQRAKNTRQRVFAECCTRQRSLGVPPSGKQKFAEIHLSDTRQSLCRVSNTVTRQKKK